MNNKLLNVMKEADPDFKKYLEEKIIINRENFNKALSDVYDISPDNPVSDMIELAATSTSLWRLLKKYSV